MTDAQRDGFLHRWSRRKVQAREGSLPDDTAPAGADSTTDAIASVADGGAADPAPPVSHGAPPEPAPPTLDDVRALTSDSDFAPFVAQRVTPEVKNAALKKLFSDPHYNVMDGLDTYIDDYSRMEPLPASMLGRLASARALAMLDEDPARQAGPDGAAVPSAPQAPAKLAGPSDAAPTASLPQASPVSGSEAGVLPAAGGSADPALPAAAASPGAPPVPASPGQPLLHSGSCGSSPLPSGSEPEAGAGRLPRDEPSTAEPAAPRRAAASRHE